MGEAGEKKAAAQGEAGVLSKEWLGVEGGATRELDGRGENGSGDGKSGRARKRGGRGTGKGDEGGLRGRKARAADGRRRIYREAGKGG